MHKIKFWLWSGIWLFAAMGLKAQDNPSVSPAPTLAPKYANEFLKIGVGARALGMGNAQTSVAEDVHAGYWNPAGLARTGANTSPEVALMHAAYFANIANYNYIGFAMPVDSAGQRYFGVSLIRMGIDDIPNTLALVRPDNSLDYGAVSSFAETSMAALLSYAWRPASIKGLSLGANVKIIYRGAGNFVNAWGFGLDLGARYQIGNFRAGLTVLDATNTLTAWTFNTETFQEAFINTGNLVPTNSVELTRPAARLGVGYDLKLAQRLRLLVSADADITFDGNRAAVLLRGGGVSVDPRAGMELAFLNNTYQKVAFLRAGVYNLQNAVDASGNPITDVFPTAGVGFVVKNFQIDYALANIGNLSQNLHSHVVSLNFHIE